MFGNLGTTEIILILLGILILFGAKRIPELARGFGKGIAQFRREIKEMKEETVKPFDEVKTNISQITEEDSNENHSV